MINPIDVPGRTVCHAFLRAIRVEDMRNEMIGHLRRDVASRLSPLIDRGGLTIEGYVQGGKGACTTPIDIICLGLASSKTAICTKLRCGWG